jgi:hypothetical protein
VNIGTRSEQNIDLDNSSFGDFLKKKNAPKSLGDFSRRKLRPAF